MQPASFKIPINKLSPAFIKNMKEKYGEAELQITVNRNPDFIPLTEETFWSIIDLLDWKKKEDADILAAAIQKLATLPIAHIYSFEDLLSEKLYQLDQQVFAENIGDTAYQKGKFFSVDSFLYMRACVVANGETTFKYILENPEAMPKGITFEPLLTLATKAYHKKTGREFDYAPAYNYETFANKKGWKK